MIGLKDGTPVTLREPTKEDVERYMRFFGALPENDRLYLRYDDRMWRYDIREKSKQ